MGEYSEELNQLFEQWKNKNPFDTEYIKDKKPEPLTIDHKNNHFIPDGIVDEEAWGRHDKKRILYVLKEAYTEEDAFNLTEWIRNRSKPKRMWNRVADWTFGIQNTTKDSIEKYHEDLDVDTMNNSLKQIAVLNLKKSGGESSSNMDEIRAYAKHDRAEIRKEFELIDADIVVCGSTFRILNEIVFSNKQVDSKDNWFHYLNLDGKERLYIDYYHPAIRGSNLVYYYAIVNIYQQALIDWDKRHGDK